MATWTPDPATIVTAETKAATASTVAWAMLRGRRDALLAGCDYVCTRHRDETEAGGALTLTAAHYTAWLTYRQALRDLPAHTTDPANPTWPTPPAG